MMNDEKWDISNFMIEFKKWGSLLKPITNS